jgi:hypothetical protein
MSYDGAAASPSGGLDHAGCPESRHRLAQGGSGHGHPVGQLTFGRQEGVPGVDAKPDRGGQLFHARLERMVTAHRAQDRAGEVSRR